MFNLYAVLSFSKPGVKVGCRASCQSNPCQNEARCVEHWGSYTCICTNQWAHWGDSCEISKTLIISSKMKLTII